MDSAHRGRGARRDSAVIDLLLLALTFGLYVASAGFVRLCERM
jgi:hypothetical protein